MSRKYRTLYVYGFEESMKNEILDFYNDQFEKNNVDINWREFGEDQKALINIIFYSQPHLLIADYDKLQDEKSFCENLSTVSRTADLDNFFTILFVADLHSIENKEKFLHAGVNLILSKDLDFETYLLDTLYLAFDLSCKTRKFATKSNLCDELTVRLPCFISKVSEETICIESDLIINDKVNKFSIEEMGELFISAWEEIPSAASIESSYLERNFFHSPVDDPFSREEEIGLQYDTFETHKLNHPDMYKDKNAFIYFYNVENNSDIEETLRKNDLCYFFDFFHQKINYEQLKRDLPSLIVINTNQEEKINILSAIKDFIKNFRLIEDFNPLILLYGQASESEALRKILEYEKIIAFPEIFVFRPFIPLLQRYIENYAELEEEKRVYPKLVESNIFCTYQIDIQITSFSEHEVSFFSHSPLPFFSSILLDLPIKMMVLIIPPKKIHINEKNGKYYEGIIHGVNENELKLLRVIVNQFIYEKLLVLREDVVQGIKALSFNKKKGEEDKEIVRHLKKEEVDCEKYKKQTKNHYNVKSKI